MRTRTSAFTACMVSLFLLLSALPALAQELDSKPFDPAVDTDIDMYMHSWKESMPRNYHGSLVLRDIFTPGDPFKPAHRGQVLRWFSMFSHATLEGGASTTPTTLKGEQEVYYVLSGTGRLVGGGKTFEFYPGMAALIPENLKYTVTADRGEPLIMFLIAEPLPPNFKSRTDIFVRDENTAPIGSSNAHWSMNFKDVMNQGDGMVKSSVILAVWFSPMTMGQPHSHEGLFQEMWVCLEGDTQALLGKQLRAMPPGTAYCVPPDGKTPHANINVSGEPVKLFHLRRHLDAFDGQWDGFSPRK